MTHILCNINFQSGSQIYTDYLDKSILIKKKVQE